VGVTATIDHPIPMQLSTSVGAAAKTHAVPPKLEEGMDSVAMTLNGVSETVCHITTPPDVAKQCMIVEGVLVGQPANILLDSGAQLSHISSEFVAKHQIPTTTSPIYTTLVMAKGHKQAVDKIVTDAELQLNGCIEDIDMLVLPMTHYDAILGMCGTMHTTQ
jgi:hypothetical protein